MKLKLSLVVSPTLALFLLFGFGSAQEAGEGSKPRLFVTDSKSWEMAGGFSANKETATGSSRGGARPQTAEIIKTFSEKCPDVTVTMKAEKADYVILLEHEGGKALLLKDNKFALFNKDGDSIKSGSSRTLGNAVKEACQALTENWKKK